MKKTTDKEKRARVRRIILLIQVILLLCALTIGCVSQDEINAAREENAAAEATEPLEAGEPLPDGDTQAEDAAQTQEEGADFLTELTKLLDSRSASVQIIILLTILSIAPSLLMMLTSFVRIVMVLSFTRNAMGLQQMPPNQVLIGFALILTFLVMSPVIDEIKTEAYIPYVAEQIDLQEAVERGTQPIREFMLRQTRSDDLSMFYEFSGETPSEDILQTPMKILMPAFLISEFRCAFEIGFFIYIPFLVIDMIVASTLMSMGMMMLPPITISLPFKVLLFVVVDGWSLTVQALLSSFA